MYSWARYHPRGYEVSSHGDRRFSAFYVYLDGESIEYIYQVHIKGYPSIKEGKGKPGLNFSFEEQWEEYKNLWRIHVEADPERYKDLIRKLKLNGTTILTDKFASSEINQARAIAEILNERTDLHATE